MLRSLRFLAAKRRPAGGTYSLRLFFGWGLGVFCSAALVAVVSDDLASDAPLSDLLSDLSDLLSDLGSVEDVDSDLLSDLDSDEVFESDAADFL